VEIKRCVPKDYRVAAVVSTYNSAAFISECLSNIEAQSIADQIEIVIVDAASTENEKDIIVGYQKNYDNITYIRTKDRVGIYAAWNIAITHAVAPYCISVSTNDQLRRDACEILAKVLDEDPETVLVFGDTYLTRNPHETFDNNQHYASYQWSDYNFNRHLSEGCGIGPHPMWRRSIHHRVGYFDERFIADGDQEFWMRIGKQYGICHIPVYTGLQWITNESLSGKGDTPLLEVAYIQAKYRLNILK
jgi:glycosyltransferase involved in cell wall biosynthesis